MKIALQVMSNHTSGICPMHLVRIEPDSSIFFSFYYLQPYPSKFDEKEPINSVTSEQQHKASPTLTWKVFGLSFPVSEMCWWPFYLADFFRGAKIAVGISWLYSKKMGTNKSLFLSIYLEQNKTFSIFFDFKQLWSKFSIDPLSWVWLADAIFWPGLKPMILST